MFSPERALLLVIDVQGKLARRMFKKERLFKNIQRLIQAARYLKMPVVFTEENRLLPPASKPMCAFTKPVRIY